MPTTVVTGSAGFIGGYVVAELLARGHTVRGIDNLSKYGRIVRSFDDHPSFSQEEGDVKDEGILADLLDGADYLVAGAARIGGITYFHSYAYDLLAENERIMASTVDAALDAFRSGSLRKVLVVSSSMVFESATSFPSTEGDELRIPPPQSSYGFQKLASEYFVRSAYEQYGLPYTIVRPFNCVGIGEARAVGSEEILSGNVRLAMSHVVPDLIQKVLKGQDPLHILGSGDQVRHYTHGSDIAVGLVTALEHPDAENEDFNISSGRSTTVKELASMIWTRAHGNSKPLRLVHDPPYPYDVQERVPDTSKAERMLGFTAGMSLEEMLEEVMPWVARQIERGLI